MEKYYIGLDIGTTCVKAAAMLEDGSVSAEAARSYGLISGGSHIEQSVRDQIAAAQEALREISGKMADRAPAALALSTQGATTQAVNASGEYIGNAVTWMDTRAIKEADEIEALLGGERIYRKSGWRINPSLDAAKILNMRRDSKYGGAVKYLSTIEIFNGYLTGNAVIDPTNAAIRQLYDVEAGKWDVELMAAAGITEDALPAVLPSGAFVGVLLPGAARETGLPSGMPVFNGAHDQYCAAIGARIMRKGEALISAGTTWAIFTVSDKPVFTKSYIAPGKHPVKGFYGELASLVCSGASLQWFKDGFMREELKELDNVISARAASAPDLFFYPYLTGANYPIWNLRARGAFTGISLDNDRFDFARAIMEGVAFGAKRGLADFEESGIPVDSVTLIGGAAKSAVWCQILANALDRDICARGDVSVCAEGAAMLALRGATGRFPAEDAEKQSRRRYKVETAEKERWAGKYARYREMWRHIGAYYEDKQ